MYSSVAEFYGFAILFNDVSWIFLRVKPRGFFWLSSRCFFHQVQNMSILLHPDFAAQSLKAMQTEAAWML